jgi:hypothetical protein
MFGGLGRLRPGVRHAGCAGCPAAAAERPGLERAGLFFIKRAIERMDPVADCG